VEAKKLAGQLPSLPADDVRDLLHCFLRRVVIAEDQIQVTMGRDELRRVLKNHGQPVAADLEENKKPIDPAT
jgi:hypothetical protein